MSDNDDSLSGAGSILDAISEQVDNASELQSHALPTWTTRSDALRSLDRLLAQVRKSLQNASGVEGQIAALRDGGLLLLLEADELRARSPADFHTSFTAH